MKKNRKKIELPRAVALGKIAVGRRPGAGFMADRRKHRAKTRAAKKARAIRDWS